MTADNASYVMLSQFFVVADSTCRSGEVGTFQNEYDGPVRVTVEALIMPKPAEMESCGHPGCSVCTPEGRAEYEAVKEFLERWEHDHLAG
jgi:hypothetical protein